MYFFLQTPIRNKPSTVETNRRLLVLQFLQAVHGDVLMIKCRIHDAESIGKLKAQFQFAKHLSQLVPTGSGVDIQRWDWFHPFPGCDGLGLGVKRVYYDAAHHRGGGEPGISPTW